MNTKTATLSELSRLAGKKPPNTLKTLRRAGIPKGKDGRYPAAAALEVLAEGRRQDRSREEAQLREMERRGVGEDNVLYKGKLASVRRVILQGDILEIERDKAKGKLADVEEVTAHFEKVHAEFATRLRTWRETLTSKYPKQHEMFDAAFDDLTAMLREAAEVNPSHHDGAAPAPSVDGVVQFPK